MSCDQTIWGGGKEGGKEGEKKEREGERREGRRRQMGGEAKHQVMSQVVLGKIVVWGLSKEVVIFSIRSVPPGRYLSRYAYKISKMNSKCEEVFSSLHFLIFSCCCYHNKDHNYNNPSKAHTWARAHMRDTSFIVKGYMWVALMLRTSEREMANNTWELSNRFLETGWT